MMHGMHGTTVLKIDLERIAMALEVIPNAALVMNKEGKIVAVNSRFLETFGYEENELIGSEIEKLVPERYRGKHPHNRNSFFHDPRPREMGAGRDLTGLRKNGKEFPIEIGLKPFDTPDGMVAMATIVDITERKRLEDLVKRQQEDLMELSTPVIHLWEGILVLPIVGTLDSERSRVMVEQLLQALADSASSIAIVDISGVPTVDTLVAQHLMKAIDASRLMGAECIISGIRPEIANTIVNLGLDLSRVKTKGSMSRALYDAFTMLNLKVVQAKPDQ
ncbi:PAS domain S-box protein [bacterium]|nr:PAS domain S-box protein [bacterium]MBP9810225.1 PAS domain S-box protein [bacterium]